MKIALVTNFIPPYRLALYEAISTMVEDFQIFICTRMEPNRSWPVEWNNLNVKVLRNIMLSYTWKSQKKFSENQYIHFPYNLIQELHRYSPDVIISSEMGFRSLQAIIYKKLTKRTKVVVWATISEYTEINRGWFRKKIRSWILKNVDSVIVNGESGARYISSFLFDPKMIIRSPYTTDFSIFHYLDKRDLRKTDPRILYVGRLEERKGIIPFTTSLFKWCNDHPQKKVEFWLAGEGPLVKKIKNLNPPQNLSLKLLGNISYYDLPEFYAQAHVFAFPTFADEWGMVISEAMAVGLPVLGSIYSQAVEELIVENETGWCFTPENKIEMYRKIDMALNTPIDRLLEMGALANKRIQSHTPKYAASQIMKAIKKLK